MIRAIEKFRATSLRLSSLFIFIGLFVSSCAILPPKLELPANVTTIEELEPFLEQTVKKEQPPSVSISVIKAGEPIYAKSFGTVDSNRERLATNDTVYQWWSITKLFTAVAVLQLHEHGKLSIDDPVSNYIENFEPKGKFDKNTITIKQLLSHSSGLGDIGIRILGMVHFDSDTTPVQSELFEKLAPKYNKFKYEPGTQGRYSNWGYHTLAVLIEKASGTTYEEYITQNILDPLGMSQSGFVYSDEMRSNAAKGSHPRDAISLIVPIFLDTKSAVDTKRNGILWFNEVYSDLKGSSGLIGPASDLVKFLSIFINKDGAQGAPVLSDASLSQMLKPQISVSKSPAPIEGLEFGLGWFIGNKDGKTALYHGGNGMAFVSMVTIIPEDKIAIAVLSNSTYLGRTMGLKLTDLLSDISW